MARDIINKKKPPPLQGFLAGVDRFFDKVASAIKFVHKSTGGKEIKMQLFKTTKEINKEIHGNNVFGTQLQLCKVAQNSDEAEPPQAGFFPAANAGDQPVHADKRCMFPQSRNATEARPLICVSDLDKYGGFVSFYNELASKKGEPTLGGQTISDCVDVQIWYRAAQCGTVKMPKIKLWATNKAVEAYHGLQGPALKACSDGAMFCPDPDPAFTETEAGGPGDDARETLCDVNKPVMVGEGVFLWGPQQNMGSFVRICANTMKMLMLSLASLIFVGISFI